MDNATLQTSSLEEIIRLGEQIYFDKKDELERKHNGKFVVIDVDSGDYVINEDKTTAIQEAEKKHPEKLFFIAQVGNLKARSNTHEASRYAMPF